jgi:hypothetical protein
VAIDGGLAVVGSHNSDDLHSGKAYLFNVEKGFVGDRQLDQYRPLPPHDYEGRNFAIAVAISGNSIIAREEFSSAYLWDTSGEPTVLPSTLTGAIPGQVAFVGDTAAIGLIEFGEVRLFDKSGALSGYLPAPPGPGSAFGFSLAISGDLLVVGAPGDLPHERAVYVYRLQDVLFPEPGTFVMVLIAVIGAAVSSGRHRQNLH